MNQQPTDLRRSTQIARRHKVLIGIIAAVGLAGGGGYAVLNPPMFTSQALVILPVPKPDIQTQTLIAGSAPVLIAAQPAIGTGDSLVTLQKKISAANVTPNAIQITARDKTAALAEKEANAVAASYISYISSTGSPVGRVTAHMLVTASTATGAKPLMNDLEYGGIGLLAGALIGFIVALRKDRANRRLQHRDDVADAVGLPVLTSVPVDYPTDAPGWARFFESYEPDAARSAQLRTLLDPPGLTRPGAANN